MTTTSSDGVSVVPGARSVPLVAGDTPAMREWAEQLVARARAEGVELTGDEGLLTAMIRQVLQTGLEVELSDHLGYEPHDPVEPVRKLKLPEALLSPRQREILTMLYDRDMEVSEVALALGIDPQTVRSAHHKAMIKLRAHFRAEVE